MKSDIIFVKAAGDVSYHRVIEALDVAYGAGATRVGVLDPADDAPGNRTRAR